MGTSVAAYLSQGWPRINEGTIISTTFIDVTGNDVILRTTVGVRYGPTITDELVMHMKPPEPRVSHTSSSLALTSP